MPQDRRCQSWGLTRRAAFSMMSVRPAASVSLVFFGMAIT